MSSLASSTVIFSAALGSILTISIRASRRSRTAWTFLAAISFFIDFWASRMSVRDGSPNPGEASSGDAVLPCKGVRQNGNGWVEAGVSEIILISPWVFAITLRRPRFRSA